jgi:ABC-type multidrug transport system ATPase subunit
MTTHDVARGLAMADRVLILSGGRIAYEAPAAGLEPVSFAETYAGITGMAGIR